MIREHAVTAPAAQAVVRSTALNYVAPIAVVLLLAFLIGLSIYAQEPPSPKTAEVSASEYSAGRAMKYLSVIAAKPHPSGSAAQAEVRDYLMNELRANGLEPQVQGSTRLRPSQAQPGSGIQNVMARLKGTGNGKALLLMAHYDSVRNSFGASDDGSGVATLLETLRTLKTGALLKNDVIFLFTDAEEAGMLGAQVFVTEHPWARDVGLVLNFEARGNRGPVIMFETSDHNLWLIDEFAKAAPLPVAHSLSYEIYKLLPNDTDLSVFKDAGVSGLNFANIDGIAHYHSSQDTLSAVDGSSMQHQGSYAVALTQHFGNLDLSQTSNRNAVYFDLFGRVLVHYSSIWVLPLTLLVVGLFITLLVLGFRKRRLTAQGIFWGALSLLVSIVVSSLAVMLVWKVIWMLRPQVETLQSRLLLLGFVTFTVAATSVIYIMMRRRWGLESLTVGALLWWLLLTLIVGFFIPGGSFLFHWPLLACMVGVGWLILRPEHKTTPAFLILTLCAVPAIILWVPVIFGIFVGLTLNWISFTAATVVLLFGLLLPLFGVIAGSFKQVLPGTARTTHS